MLPRCTGMWGALAINSPAALNSAHEKSQPFLDVHAVGRVLQPQPHLLGDVHEQVVEHLQHHRVGVGADGVLRGTRYQALQLEGVAGAQDGLPAGFDDRGRVLLGNDRGAEDGRAGAQRLAHVQAGVEPGATVHAHARGGLRCVGLRVGAGAGAGRSLLFAGTDGLGGNGFDHQRPARHQECEALPIAGFEVLQHGGGVSPRHLQCRVGAEIAQTHVPPHRDGSARHALAEDVVQRCGGQRVRLRLRGSHAGRVERLFDAGFAHRDLVRQTHAVGTQHAGQRVHEDTRHAQRVGHQAGMLAAGAAEALQRVLRDVVAARHADALDGIGHVLHRDLQEAFGQRLGCQRTAGGGTHLGGQGFELRHHAVAVQRLVGLEAEDARKVGRLDLAQQHIGVGGGQRAAASVAGRAGVGAGTVGADAQPRTIEAQHRATACGHGVDAHHRRAHAHAGNLGLEGAFEGAGRAAGEVADIGAGAAHVEADDLVVPGRNRGAHHADDARRRGPTGSRPCPGSAVLRSGHRCSA